MPTASGRPGVLVVGVGYVGRRLLDALPPGMGAGFGRSAHRPGDRRLDLDDEEMAPIDFSGDPAVVYTVPPARNDDGDRRLQSFLRRLGFKPRRIVYLSTTGVYGNRDGRVVDESAEVAPGSGRARRRVSAERLLKDFCAERSTELIILRVPGIYGPGRLGVERIREGRPVLDEAEANPGNRIHVDDLVACCLAALDDDVPSGIYNVGDGDERSSTWFAREVARQLDIKAPPTISRSEAEKLFSQRRLSFLAESRRLDLKKMHETLKVRPRYFDAAHGIAASLEEERRK